MKNNNQGSQIYSQIYRYFSCVPKLSEPESPEFMHTFKKYELTKYNV